MMKKIFTHTGNGFPFRFSTRVFLYLFSAFVIIVGALNYIYFQTQKTALENDLNDDGRLLIKVLSHSVKLGVFAKNVEMLKLPILSVLENENAIEACVLNKDGGILSCKCRDTHSDDKCDTLLPFTQRITNIRETWSPEFVDHKDHYEFWAPVYVLRSRFSDDAMFFEDVENDAQPVPETIGYAGLSLSKAALYEGTRKIILSNLGIGLLFLALSLVITFFIVREVVSPLKGLISKIRGSHTTIDSEDEFGILAGTMEHMIDELESAFETINDLKNNLEVKVADRTKDLHAANLQLADRSNSLEKTLKELRDAQSQLVHSEKMAALGQVVAGVAHEINNTINFISGALPPLRVSIGQMKDLAGHCNEILKETETTSSEGEVLIQPPGLQNYPNYDYDELVDDVNVLLENVQEGVKRTTKIVMDLKNFSRPDREEVRAYDVHENIESTLALLYHEYKYNIEIRREYSEDIPKIPGIAGQLNQVFMNILINAVQSISGKGRITIRTWKDDDSVHIAFRDTGGGIDASMLDRIFEPFFTTKEVGKGTGLGLSISYGIIKNHHGDILVHSHKDGTEFEVVLKC